MSLLVHWLGVRHEGLLFSIWFSSTNIVHPNYMTILYERYANRIKEIILCCSKLRLYFLCDTFIVSEVLGVSTDL